MGFILMNPEIEKRISILRFVMIFGIVVLHTPDYVSIGNIGSGWFDLTKAYFQHAVFRCTVPVLTAISGYLLFSSGLDTNFPKLITKKIKSLAIPFLIFNSLLALLVYLIESQQPLPISYQLYPFNIHTMMDAAFGLTTSPINYPLNFLRDLMVLMIMAPLFGWMLRKIPLTGLLIVVVVALFHLSGYLILRKSMLITFYFGGLLATKKWDLQRLDSYAWLLTGLFIGVCTYILVFKIADTTYLRLIAPLLVWPAAALLSRLKIGTWIASLSRYSFFIFLAHAPVLLAIHMIYKHLNGVVPYEIYWFVSPVITATILIGIYKVGMAFFPKEFSWLIGSKQRRMRSVGTTVLAAEGLATTTLSGQRLANVRD
jgi:succinoglycan biosynthesis protein ExoH